MQLSLSTDVLDRLDPAAALDAELDYAPPYLPAPSSAAAFADHRTEAAALLAGQWATKIDIEAAEVLQAVKRNRGIRPVAILDLETRILYRALLNLVADRLPPLDRSFEARTRNEREPATVPHCTHVVVADVAGFYQYVDHGVAVAELVGQTGDASAAETIAELLNLLIERDFGLPQVFHPSDVLSDIVIDVAERNLVRRGHRVWRYTDDFRISALSWYEANQALFALDEELRKLGFVLNDEKTIILTQARYAQWLQEPNNRWNEINELVEVDLRAVGYDEPDEGFLEGQQQAEVEQAALRALHLVLREAQNGDRLQAEVNRQLAMVSIGALSLFNLPSGLEYCRELFVTEPQQTPQIARYLTRVADSSEAEVVQVCEEIVGDPRIFLSGWQAVWLFEPLRQLENLSATLVDWTRAAISTYDSSFVRARAGLLLAENGQVDDAALLSIFGSGSRAAKDEVAAGLARILEPTSPVLTSLRRESPSFAWILDSVPANQ